MAELTVEDLERRVGAAIEHAREQMAFHEEALDSAEDEETRVSASVLFLSFASQIATLEKLLESPA